MAYNGFAFVDELHNKPFQRREDTFLVYSSRYLKINAFIGGIGVIGADDFVFDNVIPQSLEVGGDFGSNARKFGDFV